jgi:hypothetical protein
MADVPGHTQQVLPGRVEREVAAVTAESGGGLK